jgi:hypothetical protein
VGSARRHGPRVHAGSGHVHHPWVEGVRVEEQVARPPARRDDRGGRREDAALTRRRGGIRRPERHVDEDDETQPIAFGPQHGVGAARHEAVDEHEGARGHVRQEGPHACERR